MQSAPPDDDLTPDPGELPRITIACPLCDSESSRPVTTAKDYVYRVPGEYVFVQCTDCQHVFINPRPSDQVLMHCYPAHYAPHLPQPEAAGSTAHEATLPPKSRLRRWLARVPLLKRFLVWLGQQHATVLPTIGKSTHARLLEVGCAHGGYLEQAAAAGWSVDGIEPDEDAAKLARKRGFEVVVGTFSETDIPDSSRHAVVAWMVLEHVADPVSFLRHAQRILTPGGTLCLSVPNGAAWERRLFGRFWLGYDAPRHLQVFTARRLVELLHETGFEQVKVIHQASLRYWWGSIAAWGVERRPAARWPRRWMDHFVGEPPRWWKWLLVVPEKILALLHQSGRITVIATKPL